jgi:uncharacterized protein DUF397
MRVMNGMLMNAVMCVKDVRVDDADSGREWRRSSRSYGAGNCVEVGTPSPKHIDVRDSENPRGTVLRFTPAQWNAFVAGVRSGSLGL